MTSEASVSRWRRMVVIAATVTLVCSPQAVPVAVAGTEAPPPRLFFTDLESGPVTGGEGDLGVFIAIYGEGFGSARGSSTVTIGGTEVARYVDWGADNAPARGLDMIVVQAGGSVSSGDIVVTVGGLPGNGLPFTVRDGSVFFVAPNDPDSDDANDGSASAPFRTLHRPRASMNTGDVCYLRDGRYDTLDPDYAGWDTVLMIAGATSATGTPDRPIAYVGYPGEVALLAGEGARRGVLLNQDEGAIASVVVANLSFTEIRYPLAIGGNGHRAVGNTFFDAARDDSGVIGINGDTSDIEVHGNRLFHNGEEGEKLFHGFYIGGHGANSGIDFGWNEVDGQRGGRSVQLYGHLDGDFMDDIRIHDNFLRGAELNNIVVGGSDGSNDVIGTVRIWNNVIVDGMEAGLRVNTTGGTVVIENNTLHGNLIAQVYLERAGADRITLRDNILSCGPEQAYVASDEAGPVRAGFNLYFGSGEPPAWDPEPRTGDPLFVAPAAGDFRCGAGSAAIDAGTPTAQTTDHMGVARPQDAGFDIGAIELAGDAPPPPPDLPQLSGSWTKIKRKSGRKVKARFEVRNAGDAASGSFTVNVYFSRTEVIDPDAVLAGSIEVGPLQPGAAFQSRLTAQRPNGYGYIVAFVDEGQAVEESDEDDNVIAGQIP